MVLEIIIGVGAILGSWGAVWYRVGKLTEASKHHNEDIKKLTRKVNKVVKKLS